MKRSIHLYRGGEPWELSRSSKETWPTSGSVLQQLKGKMRPRERKSTKTCDYFSLGEQSGCPSLQVQAPSRQLPRSSVGCYPGGPFRTASRSQRTVPALLCISGSSTSDLSFPLSHVLFNWIDRCTFFTIRHYTHGNLNRTAP